MGESNTLRLDSDHWDGIDQRVEQGDAANRSEAARQIMSAGLHSLGYQVETASSLARAGNLVGWACGLSALLWLTLTFAYPIELRMPALVLMFGSLAGFGVARLGGLGLRERLAAALGGEKA